MGRIGDSALTVMLMGTLAGTERITGIVRRIGNIFVQRVMLRDTRRRPVPLFRLSNFGPRGLKSPTVSTDEDSSVVPPGFAHV
jgi:hypothetical protein